MPTSKGIGISPLLKRVVYAAVSNNATVQTYLNKATLDGYTLPTAPKIAIYNTAWDYADAEGLTTQFDLVGLFKVGNQNLCKIPFIHSGGAAKRIDLVSTPTFTANVGVKGDGAGGHIDTNYSPSIDGVNYTLNNAGLGVYVVDNIAVDVLALDSGNDDYGTNVVIFPKTALNTVDSQINNDDFNRLSVAVATSVGLTTVYRTGAVNMTSAKNGVAVITVAGTTAVNSLPTYNVMLLGTGAYTANLAFVYAGSGSIDQAKLNTFVNLLLL